MNEKGKAKSVRFTFLEANENALGNGAIPESKVNVANRQVNLSDVTGEIDWENKDWPEECSIIIDT